MRFHQTALASRFSNSLGLINFNPERLFAELTILSSPRDDQPGFSTQSGKVWIPWIS